MTSAKTDFLELADPSQIPNIWICPPPEKINAGEVYTFNYNPGYQPEMVGCKVLLTSYTDFFKRVQDTIDKCYNIKIDMYPEMSKAGRLHFHGYCSFLKTENIIPFYSRDLKVLNANSQGEIDTIQRIDCRGSEECDPITYRCCRDCYITKQKHIMEPWCAEKGIVYHMCNYDDTNSIMNGLKGL